MRRGSKVLLPERAARRGGVVLGRLGTVTAFAVAVLLCEHGPNDGVVLLADTIWPGGLNLVALGSDHFFASLKEDVYGLALMRAMDLAVRLHRGRAPVTASGR